MLIYDYRLKQGYKDIKIFSLLAEFHISYADMHIVIQ